MPLLYPHCATAAIVRADTNLPTRAGRVVASRDRVDAARSAVRPVPAAQVSTSGTPTREHHPPAGAGIAELRSDPIGGQLGSKPHGRGQQLYRPNLVAGSGAAICPDADRPRPAVISLGQRWSSRRKGAGRVTDWRGRVSVFHRCSAPVTVPALWSAGYGLRDAPDSLFTRCRGRRPPASRTNHIAFTEFTVLYPASLGSLAISTK